MTNEDKLKHPATGTIKTRGEWHEEMRKVFTCEDTTRELLELLERV